MVKNMWPNLPSNQGCHQKRIYGKIWRSESSSDTKSFKMKKVITESVDRYEILNTFKGEMMNISEKRF